jgi:hypothetical protein
MPTLKGKALEDALQGQPWDPSVKSLTVFPQVLTMMSEKIDWTQKLGDAFLAQQKDVLAAAQTLRNKAAAAGDAQGYGTAESHYRTGGIENRHQDRPHQSGSRLRPDLQPDGRLRRLAVSAYPPYYYYPPGYAYAPAPPCSPSRPARPSARPVGRLQLGTRRREYEHQPLQLIQSQQHLESQLVAQCRPSRRGALP